MQNKTPLTPDDVRLLAEYGIIDVEQLRRAAEEKRHMKLLDDYEYKIYYSCGLWYVKLPDGRRVRRKKREDIEKIVLDIQLARMDGKDGKKEEKKKKSLSAEKIFENWQERRLAARLALGSTVLRDRRTYTQHLAGTDISRRPIGDTTREEWTAFLQGILDTEKPTAKAFARLKGVVKDILHQAEDNGFIDYTAEDVIGHVRVYKKSFSPPVKKEAAEEVYLPEELAKLKTYCLENEDPYTRCILMSIITGTRPGEVCCCRLDDLDPEKGTLRIGRTETRADENGRPTETVREGAKTDAGMRTVIIPECDRAWAAGIRQIASLYSQEWLFPQEPDRWKNRYVGTRIRSQQLRRRLKEICEKIGIPYKSPHKFRKTYASILRGAGTSDDILTSQMGHTDIKTTEEFYLRDRTTGDEKAAVLAGIPELNLMGNSPEDSPETCYRDDITKK